jgi:hypothetical protein
VIPIAPGNPYEVTEAAADAALKGERPHRPAFVRQDAHGDLPTGTGLADEEIRRYTDVVEEDFAELGIAGHLLQGANADAGMLHVDQ